MKRFLLKLSGEALAGEKKTGFDEAAVLEVAKEVKELVEEGIQLSIDGQAVCQMHNHEQIQVSRSRYDALLVRFPKERNYFSLLKDKLSQWSL